MRKLQFVLAVLVVVFISWCTHNIVKNTIDVSNEVDSQWEDLLNTTNIVYTVKTWDRWDNVWEDIFVYDGDKNLVLSLVDQDEAQYYFAIQWNYIILDNGTSASQRLFQVYDISKGEKVFEADYYPWENSLELDWDIIKFFQRIQNENLSKYPTLAICENEYDNGYITNMEYTIWQKSAKDLQQVKCAYFE